LQQAIPFANGQGVPASIAEVLSTGFDTAGGDPFKYYSRLHVGATAWAAVFAQLGFNPYTQTYAPRTWKNPVNPLDVSADGFISPIDAVHVINHLNSFHELGSLPGLPQAAPPYLDVDGDGSASPIDAVLVINYLNANPVGQGASASLEFAEVDLTHDEVDREACHWIFCIEEDWLSMERLKRSCRGGSDALRLLLT
jgi:hypothetical protein